MTQIFGYSLPVPLWLTLSIFLACWVGLSFLISSLFDRCIRRSAQQSQNRLDNLVIGAIHGPLLIFLLLIGGWIALEAVELTPKMARFSRVGISLATAFILTFAGVKIYHGLLMGYGQRYEPIRPSLNILDLLGKGLIILIGVLITLDRLSISIPPADGSCAGEKSLIFCLSAPGRLVLQYTRLKPFSFSPFLKGGRGGKGPLYRR
jgi:hypothetical protein